MRRPVAIDAASAAAPTIDQPFDIEADRGQRHQTRSTASRRHRRSQWRAARAPAPRRRASADCACPAPPLPPARLRPRSRSGFRGQTAEAALAPGVFGDRAFERGLVEIGPMDRHEHEFAIGGLPHQEIRQPLLAAGADDQIGIGNIGRIEISAERVGVDRRRIALSFRDFARQPLRRVGDFLPRSVVEGDDQIEPGVVARSVLRLRSAARRCRARARRARRSRAPARRRDASVARSLRMKRRSRPNRSPISVAGRDQFSELKEKIVR